jgi:hypothetical protein
MGATVVAGESAGGSRWCMGLTPAGGVGALLDVGAGPPVEDEMAPGIGDGPE